MLTQLYAYAGKTLRVNLTSGEITEEPTDPKKARIFLGGRGLNVSILYDEVGPEVDPLSPENRLIFGVGPLTGTLAPGSRCEVTAKSPITGILGTSNVGRHFGPELKFAGYDQVVIHGKSPKPVYLWILCAFLYPLIGLPLGHYYPKTCIFGVFPCPTTVFALALLAAATPKVDKKAYTLLLIWALPSIGKCFGALDLQEDCILFIAGVYGLIMLVKNWKATGAR